MDEIIDLSLYEKINLNDHYILPWCISNANWIYIDVNCQLSPKKTIPIITLDNLNFFCGDLNITNKVTLSGIRSAKKTQMHFQFLVYDSATVTSIQSKGVWVTGNIIADCRDRL